jgi:hypothetical protein
MAVPQLFHRIELMNLTTNIEVLSIEPFIVDTTGWPFGLTRLRPGARVIKTQTPGLTPRFQVVLEASG